MADVDDLKYFKYFDHISFGTCSVAEDENLILTVGNKELDATNITEDDVQWLEQKLDLADCNGKDVTAMDANVQNSRYAKAFLLNFDIKTILDKMEIDGYSKPYKMNLYKSGSVIVKQRNAEYTDLKGTLILTLPTEYTGGELRFNEFNVDEYQKKLGEGNDKSLRFIYFDTEMEHSLTEVMSGYRINLVYDIFEQAPATVCKPIVKLSKVPKKWINELLKYAYKFCKDKKNILLGSFKYRNSVYNMVIAFLNKHFEVIDVAVEDTDTEIEEIKEVYTIRDDDDGEPTEGQPCFDDYVQETYKVEHILFPSHTMLDEDKIGYHAEYDYRHLSVRGDSPFSEDGEMEYLKGCLINPKK